MLTSIESEAVNEGFGDVGLGGYLWTLSLADLHENKAPTLVLKGPGSPLLFAHKSEGVTVLNRDLVLVVHDDDRVLGREHIENPETQFSRGANQAAYTLVLLSTMAAQTLPDSSSGLKPRPAPCPAQQ